MTEGFRERIAAALDNQNLRRALGNFADAYLGARENAYQGKDFEAIRRKIAGIKKGAAENMEELAHRFTRAAEKAGAVVYRASTPEEARDYIKNLAQARGVKSVVKSKSMVTEEIHLNRSLKEAGIEVRETDLGEWIIQLSGQKPSHMVMPAIHMTRGEVAGVFSAETGKELSDEIPVLVKVAREELRQKFLAAGMGISGANIAVAETGTIVMVTNEGNGRLTTTLPPLHVAVVGLDKLVSSIGDVAPILEALPRSATAQHMTSYVTMITGPVPAMDRAGNPVEKEMHIVLLDNGRTKMASDPVFKEALQCIRCASCLNVCPVFQLVGGHVYGHVYTGGIGTILTAFHHGLEKAESIQSLCLGCERCKAFCPAGIDIPALIRELRARITGRKGLPAGSRFLLETVLPSRSLFHGLIKAASAAQKPFVREGGYVRHLPLFLAGLTRGRSLPAIAGRPFRDVAGSLPAPRNPGERIGFFAGCLIDFVYPRIGEAVHKILAGMGCRVVFPPGQTCCGLPASYMGAPGPAARIARQNIAAFGEDCRYILTACPTCATFLKRDYPRLLREDGEWAGRAERFAARVVDFSSFVSREGFRPAGGFAGTRITYHDSCHLKRNLGVFREPRELLAGAGYDLVEMKWPDRCCGFGGSYSMRFPEVSRSILEAKIKDITETGARVVATDCPGCLLQLAGGLDAGGRREIRAAHTAELLCE
ncbi:MAG: LUD domain-containing protein [Peptococcaceae bacterium]|nr:LUD domain-containing protein [Peptococcaceae bacterium]